MLFIVKEITKEQKRKRKTQTTRDRKTHKKLYFQTKRPKDREIGR